MAIVYSLAEARSKRERRQAAYLMANQPARVIAITSGKGGVGKTHTTVNLGLALSRLGKRVLLLDADLGLANINVMLGFQPQATLKDVVAGKAKLAEVIVSHPLGFDVIPAASGIPELTNLSPEERLALTAAVEGLGVDYDYLLVDTAAGIGDNVMYFNVAAEEILVVVDQEPTSLTDAYALIKVLSSKYGVKQFNVLANRTPVGVDGRTTYAQLAATTDRFLHVSLKYIGAVTDDQAVRDAVRAQKPFIELYPSAKASLDIARVAKRLVESEGERTPRGGMQFFFKALLGTE